MSMENNHTTTEATARPADIFDQLRKAGVDQELISKTFHCMKNERSKAMANAARLFYRPFNGGETLTRFDFAMHLDITKRRAWALDNALARILDDEDDAGTAGTLQLVEDVVMGIERLSEAFAAERWLARESEPQS